MAGANRVTDLVEVKGYCSPDWFDTALREHALIISDCEGYERDLFPSIRTRALLTATLLIELHEAMAPGATEAVMSKFRHTHDAQWVQSHSDRAIEWPGVESLSIEELESVAREIRPPQEWVLLTPKAATGHFGLPAGFARESF